MAKRPNVACCRPTSTHGAARPHWFHREDCVLRLAGEEIDPYEQHPAGKTWDPKTPHRAGCFCDRCVYRELNFDRDDDITDVEVSEL